MNRNVMKSVIAAACLGAALSSAHVWAATNFVCGLVSEEEDVAEYHCYWTSDFDFEGDITQHIIEELELTGILPNREFKVVVALNWSPENDCLYVRGTLKEYSGNIERCTLGENSITIEVLSNTKRTMPKRWRIRCLPMLRVPPGFIRCRRDGDRTDLKDCEERVYE